MGCSKHWVGSTSYSARALLIFFVAVRAGGFYVVTIADLRQGLLVLYGGLHFLSREIHANHHVQSL